MKRYAPTMMAKVDASEFPLFQPYYEVLEVIAQLDEATRRADKAKETADMAEEAYKMTKKLIEATERIKAAK